MSLWYCKHCDALHEFNAFSVCPTCGQRLEYAQLVETKPVEAQDSIRKKATMSGVIAVVLLIIAIVIGWRTYMESKDDDSVRAESRMEREQFGDGSQAPYWPSRKYNGEYTLHRGVWVDDGIAVPSNSELDRIRTEYWSHTRVVKYTLVEGEQMAPYGKNGTMILVRATTGIPSEVKNASGATTNVIPTVQVSPVNSQADGYWTSTFSGRLPCEMSLTQDTK